VVGGDFLGTAVGDDVVFIVGDVSGHGLDAALQALRFKDLMLSAVLAGLGLAEALTLANAHLHIDPAGESLATVFIARYHDGVLRYANAGHLPGHLLDNGSDHPLPPTGQSSAWPPSPPSPSRRSRSCPASGSWSTPTGSSRPTGRSAAWTTRRASSWFVGGFALLHERLTARRPEPLRDDIAAIELAVPAAG
jgi:stage II sporulation SpoE-like protein